MDKWESIAERKIREAIEAGAFDNLPNQGKPIELDIDPDPSLWMAHHLLRVNGFAPAWIEESKEIDAAVSRFRADLRIARGRPQSMDELRRRAAEINRRILTYNLKSPTPQVHKFPWTSKLKCRVWVSRLMSWLPKTIAILSHTFVISSCVLLGQPSRIAGRVDDAHRVALPGSIHPKAQSKNDQGPVDPAMQLGYITLMLRPTPLQQSMLEQLLAKQQDHSSPDYHRWLTPEQFGDRFGVRPSDYTAVVSWVESHGLHVEAQARARNWVAFSGSAAQVSKAFQTEIHRYGVNGETHFANAADLRIPEAFNGLVAGVRGLNDFWKSRDPKPEFTTAAGAHQLAPDDWAAIYDVTPLYKMGIDGTGQRLVILGRSDANQSYIDTFRSQFGLPPSQIEMHLVGPDPGITNAAGEAALDLEWAGAIARNATIVYVYANNFFDAAQAAVDQNLAPVMSLSFGTCEPNGIPGNRAIASSAGFGRWEAEPSSCTGTGTSTGSADVPS